MKMKKEDTVVSKMDQGGTHTGNKVLPISEATAAFSTPKTSPNNETGSGGLEKKVKGKGDKAKTVSRMRELLRWAAAAKAEKGGRFIGRKVLQFRNKANPKAVTDDDDQFSYESPKISFRWDVESCSTTSSVYSVTSLKNTSNLSASSINSGTYSNVQSTKRGNWITTDSEFVVLEL